MPCVGPSERNERTCEEDAKIAVHRSSRIGRLTHDRQDRSHPGGSRGGNPRWRDGNDRRLRHRRHAIGADRRADRTGRARTHHRQQQRGQRRYRTGRAAQSQARAQDRLFLSAANRLVRIRLRYIAPARSNSNWCRRATLPSAFARRAPASALSSRRPASARCWPKARKRASSTAATTSSSIRSTPTYALIKADRGDRWGNLVYRKTARNFGPIMASAAKCAIVQVREVVPLGSLDPEQIVTPGIFVQRVVAVDSPSLASQPQAAA